MNAGLERVFAAVGRPVLRRGRENRARLGTAIETLGALGRGDIAWRRVIAYEHDIGVGSLLFITVTLGFLGLITVFQVGHQLAQILPDYSMVGAAFIQIMVREFAPTIVALMVATRVGSGIAAEIGTMTVTEQVDALRMCNADPVVYLLVPRTVASTIMVLVLSIYGAVVATVSGMLIGESAFGIHPQTFLSLQLVSADDLVVGAAKCLAYGLTIPILAGHAGLSATGGSAGVGWATTRAVVETSFAVVVLDFLLSGLGFLVFR